MKLGIVVVYLFDANTEYLLDLHIRHIRKFTLAPYTIYGSFARLDPKWRQKLSLYPEIEQCEISPTELRGGVEHAYYLDRLTEIAFQKGATHVVTLHLDSFPVCMGWERTLETITDQSGTCVVADETYTACLFFTKDFYVRYRPTFSFEERQSQYLEFVKKYHLIDHSGTSYLYVCYINHLNWHILKIKHKSMTDLGDLCGGLIFHFSAAIRFSPGKGLVEKRPPGKMRAIIPFWLLFLKKFVFLRRMWSWTWKHLPQKLSDILKKRLFDEVYLGEIVKKEVFRLNLIEKSQSCLFEVEPSSEELKDAIQLFGKDGLNHEITINL